MLVGPPNIVVRWSAMRGSSGHCVLSARALLWSATTRETLVQPEFDQLKIKRFEYKFKIT
jgi:hypothetical protein